MLLWSMEMAYLIQWNLQSHQTTYIETILLSASIIYKYLAINNTGDCKKSGYDFNLLSASKFL